MSIPRTAASPPEIAAFSTDRVRCLDCHTALAGHDECPGCGRAYPVREGIRESIEPLTGRNRIAAAFYGGQGWARFRPWEQAFLVSMGGIARARMEILRHVIGRVRAPAAVGLEVGIGDGENLRFLPDRWTVHGVDIARPRLVACARRHPSMSGRLVWAEAERLPFADATFDAAWSVGGFNHYSDHERALAEMRRVTRPGGPVVIADESPRLIRAGLGHLIGLPRLDAWWLSRLGLDPDFADMVLACELDRSFWATHLGPEGICHSIWHGLGYCVVDSSTS